MGKVQPTADEWAEIEKRLMHFFGSQTLICDGYRVTLSFQSIGKMEFGIVVFVNGVAKGKWLSGRDGKTYEEGVRFYQETTRSLFSKKDQEKLKRDGFKKQAESKVKFRKMYWKNFNSLRRHFVANNDNIRWIKDYDTNSILDIAGI